MLTLRTLGTPRLDGPGGELLRGRRKELALLAYLARRPQGASRDVLADLLWGSRPDANARQSLRQALLQLKRAVPTGLETEADTVTLSPGSVDVDVAQFAADLGANRPAEAVARWQGDFLTGYDDVGGPAFSTWLDGERQGLRARLRQALTELVAAAERDGDTAVALQWAERWAEAFPTDEGAAVRLVTLLQRAGRPGEALSRHAAFAARLRRDLEIEPSAEFTRLTADLAPPSPPRRPTPASGALFTPDFVGRQPALDALHRAWTTATAGTTTLVLVEGDEGIGKTRLCEEFIRGLPAGTVVLRARGTEPSPEQAHAVVRDLLTGLSSAPGLGGAPGSALAALAALAPWVGQRFPRAVTGEQPSALPDAVAEILTAVAAETPVLVLVDDYPLADRDSRDLMLTVARRVRNAALCLLVTSRGDDTPAELVAELRGRVGETRVRLSPLGEHDVGALLGSMLEMSPDVRTAVARRLHAESGGNPLYLIETTAALLDEGRLTADERGRWRPTGDLTDGTLPVPPSVRAAARRRFEALSAPARAVAEAAAVMTTLATADRLTRVTELAEDEVEAALEELQLRRVLRAPHRPDGGFEFAHEAIRRSVLGALSGTRRRRLHARALRTLRSEPTIVPEVLEFHRRRAGPLGGRLPPWLGTRTLLLAAGVILVALAAWIRFGTGASGFAERDWIVLTDLENATGDSVFDESLTAALFVSLSQSRHVNVYPPARVRETLQRMQRADVRRLTEPLAREVAQREGIRGVVTLTLTQTGDRYSLTARLLDPASGRALATLAQEADSRDRILGALDALAVELRRALGERRGDIRDRNVPLPQATTASLEALKQFAEGSAAMDEGRTTDGLRALRAAVALDSNFAWAHAMLGRYLVWLNNPDDAAPHLERALTLTDRLPERERLWIRRLVAEGRRDRPEAVRVAREYLALYPDDRDAWFSLGRTLQEAKDDQGALDAFRRVLEIDPRARAALINLALLFDRVGRPDDAVAAFERGLAIDSTLVMQVAGDLNRIYGFALLRTGDSARARAVFQRLLSGSRGQHVNGLRSLALLDAYFGRYQQAAGALTQAVQLSAQTPGFQVTEYRNRLHLVTAYRSMGQLDAARREARTADELQRATRLPIPWLGFLGQHQARLGLVEEAARTLATMEERGASNPSAEDRAAIAMVRAEVALARGNAAAAITAFETAIELNGVSYERQGLAMAQRAAGQPEAAVATLTALLADSALGWEVQDAWVQTHYELAQLYDALGDSAAAMPLYRRLAEQWRSGDTTLPALQAVRRRLGSGG